MRGSVNGGSGYERGGDLDGQRGEAIQQGGIQIEKNGRASVVLVDGNCATPPAPERDSVHSIAAGASLGSLRLFLS